MVNLVCLANAVPNARSVRENLPLLASESIAKVWQVVSIVAEIIRHIYRSQVSSAVSWVHANNLPCTLNVLKLQGKKVVM